MWSDEWFSLLSLESKLLFLYFLTNNHINLTGIAEIPERNICFETGLTLIQLKKAKKDMGNKVLFYKSWIYVVNVGRYDTFAGGKLVIARDNQMKEIPLEVKDKFDIPYDTVSIPYDTSKEEYSNSKEEKSKVKTRELKRKAHEIVGKVPF